jgi:hypothetical protein
MYWLGPGDLLVNSSGPKGDGLYRLTDTDGDDKVDKITPLILSKGGIGEHGPHTILRGADGFLYVLYGNHSFPDTIIDATSPCRGLREDNLLPYYGDPRGHAVNIRAPGGTIQRYDLEKNTMSQFVGGFRNAFDMAVNIDGEIFTYDSDMEWDVGLPWYRSTQVIHCTAGGDYGWRTGSAWLPIYDIDTLPSVDGPGRGSPVGVAFYDHRVFGGLVARAHPRDFSQARWRDLRRPVPGFCPGRTAERHRPGHRPRRLPVLFGGRAADDRRHLSRPLCRRGKDREGGDGG